MGSIFGNTTKTAVQSGGAAPQYYDNPVDAVHAAAAASRTGPSTATFDGAIPEVGQPEVAPRVMFSGAPDPRVAIAKPSFQNQTTDASGNAVLGPGLTKRGALLGLLKAGLQGGSDAIEGGALNVRPGQSGFGTGFAAAAEAPRRRMLENLQDTRLQQEAQIQENNLKNEPLLFQQKYDLTNSEINKNKKLGNYYDAGSQKREQNPTKFVPGVGLVDTVTREVVTKVDPKNPTVTSQAALEYAAAQGDEDAQAALDAQRQAAKGLKATPSGGTVGGDKSALTSKAAATAARFLQAHNGDSAAALNDLNSQIANNPVDHADLVIAAIKKGAGKTSTKKPALIFNNPQAAH